MGYEAVTYDTLGNERHKAVCELRKMKLDTGSAVKKLAIALGVEWNADNAPKSVALLQKRLIYLLGGDQQPVKFSDLFGIWKDGGDDVRGSVAALGDPAVRAAAGRGDDIHSRFGVEGLAPITTELRNACGDANDMVSFAAIESHDFDRLCDAIDAIHAGLECENAELRRQLDSLMYECRPMTDENMAEHGWVRLPLDADGVPIHIGELVDEMLPFGGYAAHAPIDTMELYRGASGYGWMVKLDAENRASISPSLLRHHHAPTVEDVLREFFSRYVTTKPKEEDDAILSEYAAKLRLAGDAE